MQQWQEPALDAIGELIAQGDHVLCPDFDRITPQHVILLDIDRFQRDADAAAAVAIVTGDHIRHAEASAGLLRIDVASEFARHGEWADREGRAVAQDGDQLIRQSEAQVIAILIAAKVGERKNGHGGRLARGCPAGRPAPEQKRRDHHEGRR